MAPSSLDFFIFFLYQLEAHIGDFYGNEMSGDRDLPWILWYRLIGVRMMYMLNCQRVWISNSRIFLRWRLPWNLEDKLSMVQRLQPYYHTMFGGWTSRYTIYQPLWVKTRGAGFWPTKWLQPDMCILPRGWWWAGTADLSIVGRRRRCEAARRLGFRICSGCCADDIRWANCAPEGNMYMEAALLGEMRVNDTKAGMVTASFQNFKTQVGC